MQSLRLTAVFALLQCCALPITAQTASFPLQETWEKGYPQPTGTTLGLWHFDADKGLEDASGKGNSLTLRGSELASKGRFGGGLLGHPGFPVQDKAHGATTAAKPASLSPKGAFTMEMWLQPSAELSPELRSYLLDKKYVDHTDYQWQLSEADKAGFRRMFVTLGFAAESKVFYSNPLKLETTQWHHVAFTYDAAGEGRFFVDGQAWGTMRHIGFGAVTPGVKALCIGDRLGSNYGGFPGIIDEVRISDGVLSFEQVALQIVTTRQVWRRMERARPFNVVCTNLHHDTLKGATLKLSFGDKEEAIPLPELPPGKSFTAPYTVDTSLKARLYLFRARLEISGDSPYATEQSLNLEITPRPSPSMPVIMWGANGDELDRLQAIGFTHFIGMSAQTGQIWKEKKIAPPGTPETIERNRHTLDAALSRGLNVIATLSPGNLLEEDPAYQRVDRQGKPYARHDICASMPEIAEFFELVGRSVSRTYGDHPAFTTALIDSEVRDHTNVSFNAVDVENYKKFAGTDIPAEVVSKGGVDWTKLKNFPADRVVPNEDPLLKYYRWFWTVGDGWNGLHTALAKGVKSSSQRDLWTFFDPAVRQPSISGAGGNVDVISHWTYTYPDPQRIGLCTDQLFAMSEASGRRQRVMKMTQLIWYRSQTAPIGQKAPGDTVAWEDHDPEAAYITIAPMQLKEALWTKLARPIQGIMYHGWQSLVPTDSPGGYRYTNPNTVHVLTDLIHDVVRPLGPTLMTIPDVRSEVAFYESFTSQMFARRGGYGSNMGWASDLWQASQYAHVQSDVIFEETLIKNGLSGRKILFMPDCDVLPRAAVDRILDWQKKGGKIIADENLCPAIKADLVLPSFKREKKAQEDKAKVMQLANELRDKLPALGWAPTITCDNPEVIIRTRRFGDALYVFVINDHREYGTYVGQHGLVMENGLPSHAKVSLKQDAANIYDLTRSGFIMPKRGAEEGATWDIDLGPGDGNVFMITPKPLLQILLDAPENATAGNTASIKATITTSNNEPLKAVIPVQVTVRDANGVAVEGTGYHAAENGILTLDLNTATNDDPGTWEIRIKELASGMETTRWMTVKKP